MKRQRLAVPTWSATLSLGLSALRLYGSYQWEKWRFRSGRFVQIAESDYRIS